MSHAACIGLVAFAVISKPFPASMIVGFLGVILALNIVEGMVIRYFDHKCQSDMLDVVQNEDNILPSDRVLAASLPQNMSAGCADNGLGSDNNGPVGEHDPRPRNG